MGVHPPFLYDSPSQYSLSSPTNKPFNPRAASEASWTPSIPKTKRDGPLIDFNKHPDSYLIIPYGLKNVEPMSPSTKPKVKRLRGFQLFLRIIQLLGTCGLLFCVITITKTAGSVSWIIKIAPAVGILHGVYGVYHLCHSATGRTPGSSASYWLFSATIDTGLIPFLAFTAILCRIQYTTGQYGWDTLFGGRIAAYDIVFATFIVSTALAALHIISLAVGIWLASIFRKIAKLPPDMNPLEDNLTARPHKRNKSEFTIEDNNMSQTTLASSKGHKHSESTDPLIAPPRTVPFMHTRNGSSENVGVYRQQNGSRIDASAQNQMYQNSNASFRASRPDVTVNGGVFYNHEKQFTRPRADFSRPPSSNNNPSSRPSSARPAPHQAMHSTQTGAPWVNPSSLPSAPESDENCQPTSPVGPHKTEELHDPIDIREWYSNSPENKRQLQGKNEYVSVPTQGPASTLTPDRKSRLYDFDRDLSTPRPPQGIVSPLVMNPSSPSIYSPDPEKTTHPSPAPAGPRRIALSDADVNLPEPKYTSQQQAVQEVRPLNVKRPSSFVGTGTKGKYYGEVLNLSRVKSTRSSKSDRSGADSNTVADSASVYSRSTAGGGYEALVPPRAVREHPEYYHYDSDDDNETDIGGMINLSPYRDDGYYNDHGSENKTNIDGKGRVVSNSGYDYAGPYGGLGPEFGKGMGRRRDVSGKVAEEGRSQHHGTAADGRARFKEL